MRECTLLLLYIKKKKSMKLIIENIECNFIPIKSFRQQNMLSDDFGISQFEPKDYQGLGNLDESGTQLNELRNHILNYIPEVISLPDLIEFIESIQTQFQAELFRVNDTIHLKDVEVEFAVAGFGDVLRSATYKFIPSKTSGNPMPSFDEIYMDWINESVRISTYVHQVNHFGEFWKIQVINHVYGRIGLRVQTHDATVYVADSQYQCPVEGFMYNLLKDVTEKIWSALL